MKRRNTLVAVPMLLLLVACAGPKWSISKVAVNSQPLGGVESVSPVMLVASTAGVRQNVNVDVEFTRVGNFQGPILWEVSHHWTKPGGGRAGTGSQRRSVEAPIRHDHFVFLSAVCTRIEPVGQEPSVRLDVFSFCGSSLCDDFSVSGVTVASAILDIDIESQTNWSDSDWPVIWVAPKPLEITCLRDSPIK